ncbi:MAG: SufE family protein [Gammaproteobacteria bacterium]|jgi:cysteine desulfuration protein SufE|nr:SufE family protein [Gammaproteobacteria bacterium]
MTQLDEIVDIFELLGDWDQRYQYLIELGEKLPAMPDNLKTENNRVKGCMSQVWITACSEDGIISFSGDSDSSVIKGILALLISLCDGLSARQIQDLDMDEIFQRLNLDEHLSPSRHVGVYAMFDLLKKKAMQANKETAAA